MRIRNISAVLSFALVFGLGTASAGLAASTSKATPKATAKATAKATVPNGMKSPGSSNVNNDGGPNGFFDNFTAAQKSCLAKKGFTIPDPGSFEGGPNPGASGRPSFNPSNRPTAMPSNKPTNRPGMGGGNFDPTVMQKAFAACGIAFNAPNGDPATKATAKASATTKAKASATTKATVSAKQSAFEKCMTAAGIKKPVVALAYDQSDPDTALALVKCQKSSGFTLPKKK